MLGSVILDLKGTELTEEEREILQHPLVGGVIFFSRNYHSPEQMIHFCQTIRKVRAKPLLLTVDHEGGRVQRFREGLTRIPAMGELGACYEKDKVLGERLAETVGWIMAAELLSLGIDLTFAPVLDLNKVLNSAIGDRAFHATPPVVILLAKSVMNGMHQAGMVSIGKHFPGHGSVSKDSHLELPSDTRSFAEIESEDLQPFSALIAKGLEGIMSAHICFPRVDEAAVSFSSQWLKKILREQCQFSGTIFSDDLNMQGAAYVGTYVERARLALDAGCDMILICNNRVGAIEILDHLPKTYVMDTHKFKKLQGHFSESYISLRASRAWKNHAKFLCESFTEIKL